MDIRPSDLTIGFPREIAAWLQEWDAAGGLDMKVQVEVHRPARKRDRPHCGDAHVSERYRQH